MAGEPALCVRTDGRLRGMTPLRDAIARIGSADMGPLRTACSAT